MVRRAGAVLVEVGSRLQGPKPELDEMDADLEGYEAELSPEARRMVEEGRLPARQGPAKGSEPVLVGSAAERVRRHRGAL